MTNLSKEGRKVTGRIIIYIGRHPSSGVQVSSDGTKKYLFPVKSGKHIEAVFIPEAERATLCISSQVGCKMGCIFLHDRQTGIPGKSFSG